MKLPVSRYIIFIIAGIWNACTIYRDVPIEVLKPREFSIADTVQVTLLYRNFKYENDTMQQYFRYNNELRKDDLENNASLDSVVALKALYELASIFGDNGLTDKISILPYNTLPRITGERLAPLPGEVINNLGNHTQSDMIISLETISYFYSRYTGLSDPGESADVIMAGIWALYDTGSGSLIQYDSMVDTLFWNRRNESGVRITVPPRRNAIVLATEVYSENFAKKFFTSWETVQRVVVIPPVQEFNLATQYVAENEWEEALELWMRYTAERYGRLSVSARYNVALAFEMLNDIDKALEWIDQALVLSLKYRNKDELRLVQNYKRILSDRKIEIEAL